MKTKYFRFLYFGKKECLLHVGEIEDTRLGERLVFLYLDGSGTPEGRSLEQAAAAGDGRRENGEIRGTGGTGYPGSADVLIVGDASENTEKVLEELLTEVTVDTVVYPQDETLCAVIGRYEIPNRVELTAGSDRAVFQLRQAGWTLYAASLEAGAAVLLHGFEQWEMFDDCVMNISVLDGTEHQGWWKEKDGFAAAMRCTVHHDYDACRYLQTGESKGYRVSSLLYGKTHLGKCLGWMRTLDDDERLSRGLRFLTLPTAETEDVWDAEVLDRIPGGYKCYYVSGPGELSCRAVSQICKKNPYQIPVATGEGVGMCCAGFLKYAE